METMGEKKKNTEHLDRLWHQDFAAGLLVAALPLCVCVGMWMWGGFWHLVSAIFWKLRSFSSVSTAYLVISYLFRAGRGNKGCGSLSRFHAKTAGVRPCLKITRLKLIHVNKTRSVTVEPKMCLTMAPSHKNPQRPLSITWAAFSTCSFANNHAIILEEAVKEHEQRTECKNNETLSQNTQKEKEMSLQTC